jgi:hypothetical protein
VIPPDDDTPGGVIDVDALMADLRKRVAEKKARGLYSVDALVVEPPPDEPFAIEELERLREQAVLHYDLDVNPSSKPFIGAAVTRVKRALVRGTSQPGFGLTAQANAYHAALMAYLGQLARELTELRRALHDAQTTAELAVQSARESEVDALRELGQVEGRVEELAAEVRSLREQLAERGREP